MISHRFVRTSLITLVALGGLGVSRAARAQSIPSTSTACATNSDCSPGFACESVGDTVCPAQYPPGDAGPAYFENCNSLRCVPGPCTTDADCPTGMVCATQTRATGPYWTAPANCPPGADCAAEVDASAWTKLAAPSCVPPYNLPCQTDSDCGPNFTCTPDTTWVCSGAGYEGPDGGLSDAGTWVGSACTSVTLSTSSCVVDAIPCASPADCPSSAWDCQAIAPLEMVCNGSPVSLVGVGTLWFPPGGVPDIDGGALLVGYLGCYGYGNREVDPGWAGTSQNVCAPPYAGFPLPSLATGAAVDAGVVSDLADAGSSAPVDFVGGSFTPGGASTPAFSVAGPAAPAAGRASSGCQLGVGGEAGGGGSLLALFGLAGVMRRRKR
jgi:hypothetical protein